MEPSIAGFLGVGAIADKMIRGFCTSKTHLFDVIYVSPRNADRVNTLSQLFDKVVICSSNQEVLDKCSEGIVFLAVRPQDLDRVCGPLNFFPSQLIVSVIATKTHEHLEVYVWFHL
jgi:pyrroline-5-carboxylate reductase